MEKEKDGEKEVVKKREREINLNVKNFWKTIRYLFFNKSKPGISFKANCYQQSKCVHQKANQKQMS